jgi:hypothetical protein
MIRKEDAELAAPVDLRGLVELSGMPRMNCMIMKMKKAIPKNRGRQERIEGVHEVELGEEDVLGNDVDPGTAASASGACR